MTIWASGQGPVEVECDGVACVAVRARWRGAVMSVREALEAVKALGWQVTRQGGVWVHLCPSCKAAERKSRKLSLL